MEKQIHITVQDRHRLLDCLGVLQEYPDKRELPHIRCLAKEIARAQVVLDPLTTPKNVITMRSRVKLRDMATQAQMECTLVYPSERASEEGHTSVLAPLGAAMLGYRVGDTFEVDLPKGRTQFLVDAVAYQPESSGDYHL